MSRLAFEQAARRNAQPMSLGQLLREIRRVENFPEQPPSRVTYLAVFRDELRSREQAQGEKP